MAAKKTPKKKKPQAKKKPAKAKAKASKASKKKAAPQAAKKSAKRAAKKAAPKSAKKSAKKAAKKSAKKSAKKAAPKTSAKKAAKKDDGRTATLVQHVFVAAPPADVYRALTDPQLHGAFTGTVCVGEPVEGGAYTAGSGYMHGVFEKLEADKLIVQTWTTTEWPKGAPPSRLEFAFEPSGNGTELTMTHSEVPLSQAENYRQGWIDFYWNPLRAHFAAAKG